MTHPIYEARRAVCRKCPFWNEEGDRCEEVDGDADQYGADANKTALAPWAYRQECEEWDKEGVP